MTNTIFLETYTTSEEYEKCHSIQLPIESFIIYCIFKYCSPKEVNLKFITTKKTLESETAVVISDVTLHFMNEVNVPWQLMCSYPIAMYGDTILAGLCAVSRHICKYNSSPPSPPEHEEGLLGFRKSCLEAPNEVSIWTKFCEVDLIQTVKEILKAETFDEVPKGLVRFENHLKTPVRVHNVYKIARDMKKDLKNMTPKENTRSQEAKEVSEDRKPKTRKWKSNKKKQHEIDSSVKIEDLNVSHQFAQGPFLTLADLVLLPCYQIVMKSLGKHIESLLPFTYKWFKDVTEITELHELVNILCKLEINEIVTNDLIIPPIDNVSLYKRDPKRHNPKRRLFTKEEDVERALNFLEVGMEFDISLNEYESSIDWTQIPDGANPMAGHLPDERVTRKSQQLQNLALPVLSIAKEGDLIVDFCSGSGHLGILIAHLLPKCTVILLENKEQSLIRARDRVHEMGLKNVYFFQCNLDFFNGKFDIGVALHACGSASDLVLDKCLKANAKFVLCPCCYGSVHATNRMVYPRSTKFSNVTIDQYLCIGHAADQTHDDHPLTVRGRKCMAVIDSDRGRLAEEFGYKVTLTKLKPLSCTPKNNLLIGVPS